MFLLKGRHAGFVFATVTMTVLAVWGLASPNPTNLGSTQSASTTIQLGPSRMMCLNQTHEKDLLVFGAVGRSGVPHCWVVSAESSGEKPSTSAAVSLRCSLGVTSWDSR